MSMDAISRSAADVADPDRGERRREMVERIARLIGWPVEGLIQGLPCGDEIGDAAELVGPWHAVPGLDGRRQLLTRTRAPAEH